MRFWVRGKRSGLVCTAVCAVALPVPEAGAQTALPEITVSAPNRQAKRTPRPVARRAPAPAATTAVRQPAAEPAPWWTTSVSLPATAGYTSTTQLNAEEGLARGTSSLGDALSTRAGLSSTSFSPVASRPVIRGLGGFRVRTQENGVGTHDMANLGEDHAVTVDPLAAGNVEVVRGPGTLRYGSQAIGGVVSASNSRIPTAIPRNGVAFEGRGGVTSVNRGHDTAAQLDAGGQGIAIHADAFDRAGKDYRTPDGIQTNSSFRSNGHAFGGSAIFADGFIGAAYQTNAMTYFIPGIASSAVQNNIDLEQTKWTSRGEWRVGQSGIDTIRYWLGYSDYRHNEVNGTGANAVVGSTFKNREFESRLEISHLPIQTAFGALTGSAGAQFGERRLSVVGATEQLLAPARNENVAAFLFEELQLTKALRMQAAGRIESVRVDGTGARFPANFLPPPDQAVTFPVGRHFMPTSASVGLLYDLPAGVVARLTAQHVERSPDPIELFYKGPHDTPRTFEIGRPDMALEKGDTFEAGLKRGSGDLRFEASVYHTRFQNFIFKNFTGITCGATFASCGQPGATFDQIIYSQRDARFTGAEIQFEKDVAPVLNGVWGFEGQYDFVSARFTDGSYVPKIPPHRVGGGLYYRDPNWMARINLLHAFAQTRLAAFETPTGDYNLLNAELSYTRKFASASLVPEMTIGIKGENLLNDRIRLHQSYKKDEVLQAGLNVRLFASMKLN